MIRKGITFEGNLENGGIQVCNIEMTNESLESLIRECDNIIIDLNNTEINGKISTDWHYKFGFYIAHGDGTVTTV